MSGRLNGRLPVGKRRSRDEARVWRDSEFGGMSLLRASYQDQRFAFHAQDSFVIGTNLRGCASCFDRSDLVVGPGSMVVIPPGETHGGHRVGREPWVWLAVYPTYDFLADLLREVSGSASAKPGFSRIIYPDPELVAAFTHAHRASVGGDDPLEGESTMIEALALLLKRYSTPRRSPRRRLRDRGPIAKSVDYIEDNLAESLSLADIAEASGYSRFHFLRVFKLRTGQTPHAYLMRRRVERAQQLLRRGDPIADAAYGAGFTDQAHLSRRFKQLVGVTPGEFVRGARATV